MDGPSETFSIKSVSSENPDELARSYAVLLEGCVAGAIGFHRGDKVNKSVEIGYWLSEGVQGKGIMTACCEAMISLAFGELEMNRVEISVAEFNHKSRAIPERLGFTLEGALRQKGHLYGKFVDHALYSLLRGEWEPQMDSNFHE